MGNAFLHVPAPFPVSPVVLSPSRSVQCGGATHSSHSPGTGGRAALGKWVCWRTKASGGVLAPPSPPSPPPPHQSSHFVCHIVMLSCRQVAVGTDRGVVVMVTRRHEGQAVGVDLMAGSAVSLSSLLLALTQLPVTQSFQHLIADLQHTHTNCLSRGLWRGCVMSATLTGKSPHTWMFLPVSDSSSAVDISQAILSEEGSR